MPQGRPLPWRLLHRALAAGALALAATAPPAAGGTFYTTAGSGVAGFSGDGGAATAADINHPRGLSATADGGYLFADAFGARVRRVSPTGVITTVAGTGVTGYGGDGGPATAARLNSPHGVAALPDGGFLILDTNNYRVRRVFPDGTIRTVAGTGVRGYSGDGGAATAARISAPRGFALTGDGGYLLADSDNHRIRRVSAEGIITTVAGTGVRGFSGDGGAARSAKLRSPFGVAPEPDGGFLIADNGNNRIRRVAADGTIRTVAGTSSAGFFGDGGSATRARLRSPHAVLPEPGGFLIADTANNRIRRVANGIITTIAGNGSTDFGGEGAPATSPLAAPKALLPFAGGLLVAAAGNARVRLLGAGIWPAIAPGTGRAFAAGGAAYTGTTRLAVALFSNQVVNVRLSSSPESSDGILTRGTTTAAASSVPYDLADPATGGRGGDGRHSIYAQWQDAGGAWSTPVVDTIVLDTVPPVATAPTIALAANTPVPATTVPVMATWTGSDATSGVASYALERQSGTGAFTAAGTFTTTSALQQAPTGASWTYRVRPRDAAGLWGEWATGAPFEALLLEDAAPDIAYAGTWTTAEQSTVTGGTVRYSTDAGASATLTFDGRGVAWVAPKSATRGSAGIYLDGAWVATVSLRGSLLYRTTVFTRAVAPGRHTLEVRNLGTSGGSRIDVDAFLVLR